jgi:hypothetical protein
LHYTKVAFIFARILCLHHPAPKSPLEYHKGLIVIYRGFLYDQRLFEPYQGISANFINKLPVQLDDTRTLLLVSVLLSQFISNVPLVALYLPLLAGADVNALMALVVGSTLAGNVFIMGAASNIIIAQNAEKYSN